MYATGCSVSSSRMCANTAPMPNGDASHGTTMGLDLVRITNVLLLERTGFADQTIPTVHLVIIIGIKVPALLISLIETLHNSLQVPRMPWLVDTLHYLL